MDLGVGAEQTHTWYISLRKSFVMLQRCQAIYDVEVIAFPAYIPVFQRLWLQGAVYIDIGAGPTVVITTNIMAPTLQSVTAPSSAPVTSPASLRSTLTGSDDYHECEAVGDSVARQRDGGGVDDAANDGAMVVRRNFGGQIEGASLLKQKKSSEEDKEDDKAEAEEKTARRKGSKQKRQKRQKRNLRKAEVKTTRRTKRKKKRRQKEIEERWHFRHNEEEGKKEDKAKAETEEHRRIPLQGGKEQNYGNAFGAFFVGCSLNKHSQLGNTQVLPSQPTRHPRMHR